MGTVATRAHGWLCFAGRRWAALYLKVGRSLRAQKAHWLAPECVSTAGLEVLSRESVRRAGAARAASHGVCCQHILSQAARLCGKPNENVRLLIYNESQNCPGTRHLGLCAAAPRVHVGEPPGRVPRRLLDVERGRTRGAALPGECSVASG